MSTLNVLVVTLIVATFILSSVGGTAALAGRYIMGAFLVCFGLGISMSAKFADEYASGLTRQMRLVGLGIKMRRSFARAVGVVAFAGGCALVALTAMGR